MDDKYRLRNLTKQKDYDMWKSFGENVFSAMRKSGSD